MAAFRLRVRSTELDLPVGELLLGRAGDCFLRIDDDLVSRRHARLLVTEETVTLEDLGSRNGSQVNGQPIAGPTRLAVGDTFEVGSQVFQLLSGELVRQTAPSTMLPHRRCRGCGILIEASLQTCPSCGARQREESEPKAIDEFDESPTTKGFADSFSLVTGLGDKLLALGRTEEAERMIGPRLHELLARTGGAEPIEPGLAADGVRRALKLAVLTGRDEWYRWVFDFARRCPLRLAAPDLDELHTNMMVHKPVAADALMGHLAAQEGDDSETALYRRRLEALLRFCRNP